jgi:hypothetical protein
MLICRLLADRPYGVPGTPFFMAAILRFSAAPA